jgi:hypothetical protein
LKLYKIGAFEKLAKVFAVLFSSIIIVLLVFFMLLFISITGGFYFGELLKSNALGFLIVFGFYFVLLVVVIAFRKKILQKYIADKIIEQLFEEEKND